MGKTVLIVYAHSENTSFNAALRDVAIETLEGEGHTVIVSDLYAMNYNPVISRNDIKGALKNPDHFNYSEEAGAAWSEGRLADDIVAEQAKVTAADLIIYQFPLHWMGLPAIMKGWCDRTFTANYSFTDNEVYDKGKLKGKRAILSLTTGAPEHFYQMDGPNGDINVLLWPLQSGILRLTGFDVLPPFISFSPQLLDGATCANQLTQWSMRLKEIFDDKPLYFIPISRFLLKDPTRPLEGMRLTDDTVLELQGNSDTGLTIGQHLHKKLPPQSMIQARE